MRLNYDCVRDVMQIIEEETGLDDNYTLQDLYLCHLVDDSRLSKYDPKLITYTCIILQEADLINAADISSDNILKHMSISRLTFEGHEYLEKIRSDTVWKKTKEIAKDVGAFSLDFIAKIAGTVITTMITKAMSQQP